MKKTKTFFRALSILLSVFLTAAVLSPVSVSAATNKAKMSRISFIEEVVKEAGIKTDASTADINAAVKKFKVTKKQAEAYVTAVNAGLLTYNTSWKSLKADISRFAAATILVAADEKLHGVRVSEDGIDEIISLGRISDLGALKTEKNRRIFVKAYALGFIKGAADGDYSLTRTCTPNTAPYESTLKGMVKMLNDMTARYSFSPDWQMLRTSKTDRPLFEQYYPYILDSYPNEYYDLEFAFMRRAYEEMAGWSIGNLPLDHRALTWDKALKNLSYEERFRIYTTPEPEESDLVRYGTYFTPAEYDRFAVDNTAYMKSFRPAYAETFLVPASDEGKKRSVELAKDYCMTMFNFDYRTADDNEHWLELAKEVEKHTFAADTVEEYLEAAKANELILECDRVDADVSSLWRNTDESHLDRLGRHVVRVHVHYRVVSDLQITSERDKYGRLILDGLAYDGYFSDSTLHYTEIGEDGLSWRAVEDNEWHDAVFEVGIDWDYEVEREPHVGTSRLTFANYMCTYSEALGGPSYTFCKPGTCTVLGEVYGHESRGKTYAEWVDFLASRNNSVEDEIAFKEKQMTSEFWGGITRWMTR